MHSVTPVFHYVEAVPAAAELVGPSGSASSTKPTFEWNAVSNSTSYRVWVRDRSTLKGNPRIAHWVTAEEAGCPDGTGTCSWESDTDLLDGEAYWWVLTWNNAGEGPWSERMNFTVPESMVPPPAAILNTPNNNETSARPEFVWQAEENSAMYYVWIRDSETPKGDPKIDEWVTAADAGCPNGTGTCSYTPSIDLASGNNARWWIQTMNEAGTGPWSEGFWFSVQEPLLPPNAANLTSPNGDIFENLPTFVWQAEENSSWYYVWVRDSETLKGDPRIAQWVTAEDAGCGDGTGTCSWTANTELAEGAVARWWIQTRNDAATGPWSDGMFFSVYSTSSLQEVTLVGPTGDVNTVRPTFEWEPVEGADKYPLEIWDSEHVGGDNKDYRVLTKQFLGCADGVSTCSWQIDNDLAGGNGVWRVKAQNDEAESEWTDGSFNITASAPPPEDPVDPGDPGDPPGEPENPSPNQTQVLVIFLDTGFTLTPPIDVRINGEWYNFSQTANQNWNSSIGGARGRVFNVNGAVRDIKMRNSQINRGPSVLNNHGYGFTSLKIMAKHPSSNLHALDNNPSSLNYWAYSYQSRGILLLRSGFNATFSPDPNFYQYSPSASWSESGKLVILVGGVGRHHPSFPANWHP